MHIRKLTSSDYLAYQKLRAMALESEPGSFWASEHEEASNRQSVFLKNTGSEDDFILGAFDGDYLIGMLGYVRENKVKLRHRGFIWGVFVNRDYRGKGFGRSLMESCFEILGKQEGLLKLNLSVANVSEAAAGLYKSLGFNVYGIEKNSVIVDGVFIESIFMDKYL